MFIKGFNFDTKYYDNIGYIIFNTIFSKNILKEIDERFLLWD